MNDLPSVRWVFANFICLGLFCYFCVGLNLAYAKVSEFSAAGPRQMEVKDLQGVHKLQGHIKYNSGKVKNRESYWAGECFVFVQNQSKSLILRLDPQYLQLKKSGKVKGDSAASVEAKLRSLSQTKSSVVIEGHYREEKLPAPQDDGLQHPVMMMPSGEKTGEPMTMRTFVIHKISAS